MTIKGLVIRYAVLIVLFFSSNVLMGATLSDNLLLNPGAEIGSTYGWDVSSTQSFHKFESVQEYKSTYDFSHPTETIYPHEGWYMFYIWHNASTSSNDSDHTKIYQTIDVSGYSDIIDNGKGEVSIGAWMIDGNRGGVKYSFEFKFTNNSGVINTSDSTPKWVNVDVWREENFVESIPPGTTTIEVSIKSLSQGAGTHLPTVCVDNAYLYIQENGGVGTDSCEGSYTSSTGKLHLPCVLVDGSQEYDVRLNAPYNLLQSSNHNNTTCGKATYSTLTKTLYAPCVIKDSTERYEINLGIPFNVEVAIPK